MLDYTSRDPVYRRWRHDLITFSLLYAFSENFVLPFSHDEVVYGKGSMLAKMPGDPWQKFATLRSLYGFMYAHPGKKLLFMGSEFGQWREWNHDQSLDWHLLEYPTHASLHKYVRELNRQYRTQPPLYQVDFDGSGFHWIDCHDHENSVISLVRFAKDPRDFLVAVINFTPVPRFDYRIGVPEPGYYVELLNSDSTYFGGSNVGNHGGVPSELVGAHGFPHSLRLALPPLGCLFLKRQQSAS